MNFLISLDGDSAEPKHFSEVTKGIVKGVGGQSTRCRTNNSNFMMSLKKNEIPNDFCVSPPAHVSKSYYSPRTAAKKSSGRRKKGSGKSSGDRTPRNQDENQHKAKHPKGPPATPTAAPSASATLELLHHHNRHEFPTNSADNFYEMDIANFDADKDDEELIKGLPMTGDATIDQEILAFFRTRQAVFKKINSDKSNKSSPQHEPYQQQKHLYHQYGNDGSLNIPQF
ncbi:hypothetical protein Ocin01_11600 [Orchesella cincta]|uniref:Uncharacterized protein n=1 Tax=Orchesella cincta TaxID=48709 RepID=A0A1D2MQB1_ORCCI|nr:hypothetical protein Ocin01_11600 [Orchesella cincta]